MIIYVILLQLKDWQWNSSLADFHWIYNGKFEDRRTLNIVIHFESNIKIDLRLRRNIKE